MKVDVSTGELRLSVPLGASLQAAMDFARRNGAWAQTRLDTIPARLIFAPFTEVPILGVPHEIHHEPMARLGVRREAGKILVSGQAEHIGRRIEDFLKNSAKREIKPRVFEKAKALPPATTKPQRITLRDPKSRWASCSSSGDLSFSWRLYLAPEFVLDYVIAHELAHLVHMDHSPAFWKVTNQLTPHAPKAKAWLKRCGQDLHRYGKG